MRLVVTPITLGPVFAAMLLSAASAQTWAFDTEVDPETGKSWRSATLKATDGTAELLLGCDQNRHRTLQGAVYFTMQFRATTLLNVLHRFEGADAVTTPMMQEGEVLFFDDYDHTVAWARGLARYARWSAHANDRDISFDLPRAPEQRQAITALVAECLKEKQ